MRAHPLALALALGHGAPRTSGMKRKRNRAVASSTLVRLWHVSDLMWEGRPGQLEDGPLPARSSRGEGEKLLGGGVTQGGARSSLALGYYRAIPTGFQFGSVRSQGERCWSVARRPG